MKISIKLFLLVILLISIVISSSFSKEVITLRVSWWGSQDRHNRTLKVIELFQQKYPNIKIVPEYSGWGDYWTILTTQAAGRNLPDVIQHDYQFLAEWVKRGLLRPLDDLVAQNIIKLSDVPDAYVAPGRVEGKLYAINLGVNSFGIVYDPELLKKAGIGSLKWNWTWDEFKNIAKQVKNKLGIFGVGDTMIADAQAFKIWLLEHNTYLYSPDGKSLGYEDDKLFSDYFKMLLELIDAGAMPSREFEMGRVGVAALEDMLIVTQKAAMNQLWSNQLVAVMKAAKERPLKLNLFPQPGKPGTRSGNYLKASMFFAVSTYTKYPKEAGLFIDFFTNSLEANKILLAERGVPISRKIQTLLRPYLTASQMEMFNFIKLVEKNVCPTPLPDPPGHTEILNNVWNPIVDQILYKKITPEQGAIEFRKQATAILKK